MALKAGGLSFAFEGAFVRTSKALCLTQQFHGNQQQ